MDLEKYCHSTYQTADSVPNENTSEVRPNDAILSPHDTKCIEAPCERHCFTLFSKYQTLFKNRKHVHCFC